jgi:hypothetical protein
MGLLHTSNHNWLDSTGKGKTLDRDLIDMVQ